MTSRINLTAKKNVIPAKNISRKKINSRKNDLPHKINCRKKSIHAKKIIFVKTIS